MTSALSFLFLLGISSRCAVPTNSVPTDGGTTIGAPAFTPKAPRLVITTGAFIASIRPPRIDLQVSGNDTAEFVRDRGRKRRLDTVAAGVSPVISISGFRSRHGCLYRFSLRRNFSRLKLIR